MLGPGRAGQPRPDCECDLTGTHLIPRLSRDDGQIRHKGRDLLGKERRDVCMPPFVRFLLRCVSGGLLRAASPSHAPSVASGLFCTHILSLRRFWEGCGVWSCFRIMTSRNPRPRSHAAVTVLQDNTTECCARVEVLANTVKWTCSKGNP
ncbi:hypothetical protein E2C01_003306 [Portunus trituberculatus]|uniref:Uncharacterized protein n=1 Tax=Portunus trituberculatus TaxID=210409 RepID=A0A5B7CNJ3_PORTR|nr:hypothetical protein [Portunus trituberculatus]